MPFGLPVWPFLVGLAVAVFALSAVAKNEWATRTMLVILIAYAGVQAGKNLPINSEYLPVIYSGIWVIAFGAIPRHIDGNMTLIVSGVPVSKVFIGLAALCYLWARITKAPPAFGSPPYVASDLLLIAAMLLIGWSVRHDFIDRLSNIGNRAFGLVADSSIGHIRYGDSAGYVSSSKASWQVPPTKVAQDGR